MTQSKAFVNFVSQFKNVYFNQPIKITEEINRHWLGSHCVLAVAAWYW
jgi:hypothetical protein